MKAVGRLGLGLPLFPSLLARERSIGLIGCGQFGFSTICYFLAANLGTRFTLCFDPDIARARRTRAAYRFRAVAPDARTVLDDPATSLIYIASNHASHAAYAAAALRADKRVYVEKPVSTTHAQLADLAAAAASSTPPFVGYNRPHSAAVRRLRAALPPQAPLTLSCTIAGHVLAADHWYRDPAEGTRICGNVGHWLDLGINLLGTGTLPDSWTLRLTPANAQEADENVTISLTSERGDLITIVLTARGEPFDGIHEMIFVQSGEVMARIDDFRAMTLWRGEARNRYRYWPKDVGHERAILQPFRDHGETAAKRWREVIDSSLWMLALAQMVRDGVRERPFSFAHERGLLHPQADR